MRMRVLLTGGAGFLGSHTLRHLLVNTDWEIICPVSFAHKGLPERIVAAVPDKEWHRVRVLKVDLSSPISPVTAKNFGVVQHIINFAAESHVDRSITDPVPFVRNNVDIALGLLEYASHLDHLQTFVQISTDEVYGPAPLGHRHAEWEAILPSNPYSASKACQEAIAVAYWRTYGVPLVVTNCMNLIGEMQDAEKFVPMLINKIMTGAEVPIHGQPDTGLVGSRMYLHARNLADAVLFLLTRPNGPASYVDGADRPDRFHIVGEREVSNLEMAHLVADVIGKPLRYRVVDFHSARPGHDLRYALDGSKIAALGWKAPVPFEASLRTLVEWTMQHPIWLH